MDAGGAIMDHQYIEEHNLADRYLTRQLSPDERARFEEHFVDCPECLDRLALAEMFRESAADQAVDHPAPDEDIREERLSRPEPLPPAPPPARLRLVRGRGVMIGAAIALLALPSAFFIGDILGMRENWREQYAALAAELEAASRGPAAAKSGSVAAERPSASVFMLQLLAPDVGTEAETAVISLPGSPQPIVIVAGGQPDTTIRTYRVSILDAKQAVVWTQSGLQPAAGAILGVTVPSAALPEGDYQFWVYAQTADRNYRKLGWAPFTVAK
jgi:Putative zinc-finger